jgi:hypothetical protein
MNNKSSETTGRHVGRLCIQHLSPTWRGPMTAQFKVQISKCITDVSEAKAEANVAGLLLHCARSMM